MMPRISLHRVQIRGISILRECLTAAFSGIWYSNPTSVLVDTAPFASTHTQSEWRHVESIPTHSAAPSHNFTCSTFLPVFGTKEATSWPHHFKQFDIKTQTFQGELTPQVWDHREARAVNPGSAMPPGCVNLGRGTVTFFLRKVFPQSNL